MTNSKTFSGNLQNIFEELARHTFSDAAKLLKLIGFRYCDLYGKYVLTINQLYFWETGGSKELNLRTKSVNLTSSLVIISLRLTDEGATTPKLVSG